MASVTVTVYVPAARFARSSEVAPLLHTNVYGIVPPETVISIEPSFPAKQFTCDTEDIDELRAATGSVTSAESITMQPLASITVTI